MITFAIPYYSNPQYLKLAIESVLKQTSPNWKILVSDDSCSDGLMVHALVESYNDKRISYFKNKSNLGIGGNWNRCLDLAETDLVTLLHADDILMPDYAQKMIEASNRYPDASAIFCQSHIIDSKGEITFSTPDLIKRLLIPSEKKEFILEGEKGLSALLSGNFIMCPTLCYRKSLLLNQRFRTDLKVVLDMEFTTRILLDGKNLVGLPIKAYGYRRHSESTSSQSTSNMEKFKEENYLYKALSSKCAQKKWDRAAQVAFQRRILKMQILFFALKDLFMGRGFLFLKKLGYLKGLR